MSYVPDMRKHTVIILHAKRGEDLVAEWKRLCHGRRRRMLEGMWGEGEGVKYSKCVGGRGEMYDIQEWSQPVSCPMKCVMLIIYGGMLVNQPQGI
jgi:hypothetical protein